MSNHLSRTVINALCKVVFTNLILLPYADVYAAELTPNTFQWGISSVENELLGIKAFRDDDQVVALKYFDRAYEIDPSMASAAFYAALSTAKLHQNDKTFLWLERALQSKFINVKKIKNTKDFDSLHDDPRWALLISNFESAAQRDSEFWDGVSWKTPYKKFLTENERIAGLSKVWSEIKYNFIFVEKLEELGWDNIYFRYLPKIRSAKSNLEYYRLLSEMVALLHDGHTNVYPSQEDYDKYYTQPLIYTELIEDKVILRWVGDADLLKGGVARGDEVVSVNGIPVKEYMEKTLGSSISFGTTQDKNIRLYKYQFLKGPIDEKIVLGFRDSSGRIKSFIVKRVSNKKREEVLTWSQYKFKMLANGIAYVRLNSFDDEEVAKLFLADFSQISEARAVILDVRENGGGNANVGFDILRTLSPEPFPISRSTIRNYRSGSRTQYGVNTQYTYPTYKIPPSTKFQFQGPVVILTAAQTFSAAEDFVVAFKNMKRGLVIGGITAGSTGQPLRFSLPGGGSARVCTKKDTFPDGTEFVGKGISPDIEVYQTITDFRSNKDTVLEFAINELNRQLINPNSLIQNNLN